MNRLQIRQQAELLSDTETHDFPTTAQKDSYVSEEARALYAEAVNIPTFPAKRTVVDITATGARSYPLVVTGLLRVLQVRIAESVGGSSTILRRASDAERALTTPVPPSPGVYWDVEIDPLVGPTLWLYPPPTNGAVAVEVVTGHPGLASDTSELYLPDPCARLVATRAAARFIEKADKDPRMTAYLQGEISRLTSESFIMLGAMGGGTPMPDYVDYESNGYA